MRFDGWTWVWIAWILLGVVLEGVALARPAKGDTLSEQVWSLYAHSTFGKFAAWMVSAFLVWLVVHFVTRGKLG